MTEDFDTTSNEGSQNESQANHGKRKLEQEQDLENIYKKWVKLYHTSNDEAKSLWVGYKPDGKEKRKQMKSRGERRMVDLKGRGVEGQPMLFPYIYETFHSVGLEHDDILPNHTAWLEDFVALFINAIEGEDVKVKDIHALVHPHPFGYKLNNWSVMDIPIVFHFHNNFKN